MPLRNKSSPKEGRLYSDVFSKTQRLPLLRMLSDHQRWLNSNGHFGKRLDVLVKGDIPGLRVSLFDGYNLGLTFNNCSLDGVDLSFANLELAEFRGVSLRKARFIGANLKHASFRSCDVAGADFSYADVSWSNVRDTNHEAACFENARTGHMAFTLDQTMEHVIARTAESRQLEKSNLSRADLPPDAFWSPGAPCCASFDSLRQTKRRLMTGGFGLVRGRKPEP
jgi:hypothetical protein